MKTGMNPQGVEIGGVEYLRQRITDVFRIQKGSVPMAREYGNTVHEILDLNVTDRLKMDIYRRTEEAFSNPVNDLDDCKLKSVVIRTENNEVTIDIVISYYSEIVEIKGVGF